jgi:hypothetical protein
VEREKRFELSTSTLATWVAASNRPIFSRVSAAYKIGQEAIPGCGRPFEDTKVWEKVWEKFFPHLGFGILT